MTGEVTLTGRVLPVGGVREKSSPLAARESRRVLIPRHNEKDLVDLPAEVKADLTLHLVDTLDDVVPRLFEAPLRATTNHPRALGKPVPRLDGTKLGDPKKERPVLGPKPTRTQGTP